jgi:hypothetical protein
MLTIRRSWTLLRKRSKQGCYKLSFKIDPFTESKVCLPSLMHLLNSRVNPESRCDGAKIYCHRVLQQTHIVPRVEVCISKLQCVEHSLT